MLLEEEETLAPQVLADPRLHHEAREAVELLVDERGAALQLVDELRRVADDVGEHGRPDHHAEKQGRHLVLGVGGQVPVATLGHGSSHPVEAHEVLPAQRRVEHRGAAAEAGLCAVLALLAHGDDDLDLCDPALALIQHLLLHGRVDGGLRVLRPVDQEKLVVAAAVEEHACNQVHRNVKDAEELDDADEAAVQRGLLPEVGNVLVHATDPGVLEKHWDLDHHEHAGDAAPRRRGQALLRVDLGGVPEVPRDQNVEVHDGLPGHAAHEVEDKPRPEPVREDLGGVRDDLVVVGDALLPEVGGADLHEEVDEEEEVHGVLKVE
mmetsp:Transcript_27315/g.69359  ORF Transcript_27315/g.69359 Transcript_27315/m.69359 type:complete len:322 (+) Transcript_27315:3135-4100(+)